MGRTYCIASALFGGKMEIIQSFDNSILYYMHEHWHNAFTNVFFPVVTFASSGGIIWIALAIIMLFSKKWRSAGIILLLSVGLSAILGNIILKNIFCRLRPFVADPSLELIIGPPSGYYSFPSGHSVAAGSGAAVIFMRHKGFGAAAVVYALLVAISRVFLAVHYPTDVLCGLILGALCSVLLYIFALPRLERFMSARAAKQ